MKSFPGSGSTHSVSPLAGQGRSIQSDVGLGAAMGLLCRWLWKIRTLALAFCCFVAVAFCGQVARAQVLEDDLRKMLMTDASDIQKMIATAVARPGGQAVAALADRPVLLWVERIFVGSSDVYSGEGYRYAVLRISVGNTTDKELEIHREKIFLDVAGTRIEAGAGSNRKYRVAPVEIDWTYGENPIPYGKLESPRRIIIPSGQAATFWCVFFGLESVQAMPEMKLELEAEDGAKYSLDLIAQQNARLALTEQQLGPGNSLTMFTIHGQLNRVNSALLAERLNRASEQGRKRFLIDWAPGSTPSDEVLFSWLVSTVVPEDVGNSLLLQLPTLPTVRQIALSRLPSGNERALEWDDGRRHIFETPEAGAVSILKEVFDRVDAATALREIQSGHPLSQYAALSLSSSRLGSESVSTLMKLAQGESSDVQRQAVLALGYQPKAEEFLLKMLRGGDRETAQLALRSLVSVASDSRLQSVVSVLDDPELKLQSEWTLPILAEAYSPAWDQYLTKCVKDPRPEVRKSAIQVLKRVGHRDLSQICISALAGEDSSVAEIAFQVLSVSADQESQQSALKYAMQQLKSGNLTPGMLSLLERKRESRAAPLLLESMAKSQVPRARLIEAIGVLGTDNDCRQVLKMFEGFDAEEKEAALNLTARMSTEVQLEFSKRVFMTHDALLRATAIQILKNLRTDAAIQLLGEALATSEGDEVGQICESLGDIGTPAAVQQLRRFRTQALESKNVPGIQIVDAGLKRWRSRLPGSRFVEAGNMQVIEDDLDGGIRSYSMAILINPELPDAYSSRGNAYLRKNQFPEAGNDFKKAFELDPFDSQAVTGVAIVQAIQGEGDQAVQFVKGHAASFPEDRYYPYNSACVYARSIEYLQKNSPTAEQKARIEELQKEAIAKLQESIELGFNQFEWMQKDPDLASIRELPEFKVLIRDE
ncbi:TPR end-of-group domain-containing protein [Planctomicrobium sp. SH527]|uniref:TPR end-of-group domain-containing protein n=1 Tax=Planctomicrobium sp. SH527 TaxID=3448123 RepID=UPI003F5B2E9A